MATAALVCGIVGLLLFFLFVPSVVALVLGVVAANRARQHPGPGDGRGRAIAGWILGLLGVLGFSALVVGVAATGGRDKEVSVVSLDVGDCVDMPDDDRGEPVGELPRRDCDEPHAAEVYLVEDVSLDADAYPGREAIDAEVGAACTGEAFEEYVGRAYAASRYGYEYLYPSAEGWEQGDREFVCRVVTADGSPLTGSVEGSAE